MPRNNGFLAVAFRSISRLALSSLLSLLAIPSAHAVMLAADSGFELNPAPILLPGMPVDFTDEWQGDVAAYVGAQGAIVPFDTQMVQFINTGTNSIVGVVSDLRQNIDLGAYLADISAGNARIDFSMFVNRVTGDASTDTRFVIDVRFFDGAPGPGNGNQLGNLFAAAINSDGNEDSWESVGLSNIVVPTATTWVQLHIGAQDNVNPDDEEGAIFPGHYADNVSLELTVVPEPSTFGMAAFIALALLSVRRKSLLG